MWEGVLVSKWEAFEHGFEGFLCNEENSLSLFLSPSLSTSLSIYLPLYLSLFLTHSQIHITLGVVFKR